MGSPEVEPARKSLILSEHQRPASPTWNIGGVLLTAILTGKDTGESISVIDEITPPKIGVPLH